ncbi:hypothetical protein IEI_03889 [Bacillus wiedmannii]|uniref:PIN domain-containing protein n=1 Tax=Bacillus cereus group sp. MS39 TaxID=3041344 RepID=A0AAU8F2E8_9BACI|nr:PIN domain-containing protein [Bacillus wiedmannii]EJQ48358.1 hypothetical protein IEI_03889 [Bacillus wiedmannii]
MSIDNYYLQNTHLVLDTNIIFRYPSILGTRLEDIKVSVPSTVLLELRNLANKSEDWRMINNLLTNSIQNRIVSLIPLKPEAPIIEGAGDISFAEWQILSIMKELTDNGEESILVTEDKNLKKIAQLYGMSVIGLQELKEQVDHYHTLSNKIEEEVNLVGNQKETMSEKDSNEESKSSNIHIDKAVKKIEQKSRNKLLFNILFLLFFGISMFFVGKFYTAIISYINVWGTLILLIVLSALIFWVRCNLRFGYGGAEFFFGLFIAYKIFDINNFGNSYIQFFGALFIMIRGLDNVSVGITETRYLRDTKFHDCWKWMFRLKDK